MTTTTGAKRTFIDGIQTTSAAPDYLTLDTVENNEDGIFEVNVIARNQENAYYIVKGRIQGGTSAATILGETTTIVYESKAGMDAVFDIATDSVRIKVTGISGSTVDWEAWYTYTIK